MGRTAQTNGVPDIHMKASSKNTADPRYAIPHTPFEEFTLKKVDELVVKLERVKPKNSKEPLRNPGGRSLERTCFPAPFLTVDARETPR